MGRALVTAAMALALGGCGATNVKRDLAERGWHELSSENFRLITDMDLDDARARFRRLEQLRWALVDTYSLIVPGLKLRPQQFLIVHFGRCRDFREVAGEGVAGYVTTMPDFQGTGVMVTCDTNNSKTLLHELVHIMNRTIFSTMPLWLNEGLAAYYETLRVRDGKVRIGEFPRSYASVWSHAAFLLSLDELRSAGPDVFYELDRRPKNYFAAWKLVHMLNSQSPEYHARFRRYLLNLARGIADAESWKRAFGDLPAGKLARDYRYYQNRTELRHYEASYRYRNQVAAPAVRRLRAGEAHAVWVALQLIASRKHGNSARRRASARAAVERHLDFMESDDPGWSGVLYWRAIAASAIPKRRAEAIALLRKYVAREPKDSRGWLALVALQMPNRTGLEPDPPRSLASIRPDVMKLVEVGHSAADLNVIGWFFALSDEPATGLNFARRAIAQRPGCADCWDTLALLLFRAGKHDLAVAAQERAISMLGDTRPSDGALARLAAYRRAAKSARPATQPEAAQKPRAGSAPTPRPRP